MVLAAAVTALHVSRIKNCPHLLHVARVLGCEGSDVGGGGVLREPADGVRPVTCVTYAYVEEASNELGHSHPMIRCGTGAQSG